VFLFYDNTLQFGNLITYPDAGEYIERTGIVVEVNPNGGVWGLDDPGGYYVGELVVTLAAP
jgi:hypothetical protein